MIKIVHQTGGTGEPQYHLKESDRAFKIEKDKVERVPDIPKDEEIVRQLFEAELRKQNQ